MTDPDEVADTLEFVIAQGFRQVGQFTALIGFDGTSRLLAELYADRDRPDVHPAEAYHAVLYSLQPGWTLNIRQVFWPDAAPRQAFLKRLEGWENHSSEGLELLFKGMCLAVEESPLPYLRRTFLEFVLPGEEGLAWWEGLPGLFSTYRVQMKYLEAREIQELAYRTLNPGFEP